MFPYRKVEHGLNLIAQKVDDDASETDTPPRAQETMNDEIKGVPHLAKSHGFRFLFQLFFRRRFDEQSCHHQVTNKNENAESS